MKETFNNVISYLKNPIPGEDPNKNAGYRIKILFHLFIISIVTSIIITPLFSLIQELQLVDFETHKLEEMFKDMSFIKILLLGSVLTPILEETFFRAPITIFVKPKSFKYSFYIFTLIFGFIHISNFEINTNVLLLSPILILPQLLVGGYFGYIRVKFGLLWAMLLHGSYNGFLFLMSFLFE